MRRDARMGECNSNLKIWEFENELRIGILNLDKFSNMALPGGVKILVVRVEPSGRKKMIKEQNLEVSLPACARQVTQQAMTKEQKAGIKIKK